MKDNENLNLSQITIFSIGHSNVTIEKLVSLLKKQKIEILVDVRSTPFSQFNPQFNKDQFDYSIQKAGLQYKYAGNFLGGRPNDPNCYKDGKIPEGHADYLHLVNYPTVMTKDFFRKGIQYLLKLAEKNRVAVMCSEEDPSICHRHHLIGKYLVAQGVNVFHIRGDGNLVKDQNLPNLNSEPPAEQPSLF